MNRLIDVRSSEFLAHRHDPQYVYIGRRNDSHRLPRSKWANPYLIGVHGTREQVVSKYAVHLQRQPHLLAALPELRDKVLVCWCRLVHPGDDLPLCHGEVLAAAVASVSTVEQVLAAAEQEGALP